MNIVTTADINYLPFALAMYNSLKHPAPHRESAYNVDFTLHFGCLDKKTYDFLIEKNIRNIVPYQIDPPPEGAKYDLWCWAQTPIFTNRIQEDIKDTVLYVDADILFYQSFENLLAYGEGKDCAFVEHRHNYSKNVGRFNVGVVLINNIEVSRMWADCLVNPTNYPAEYGSCGDQKYLELLWDKYNCGIIQVGHGAWWNNHHYSFDKIPGSIQWGSEMQELVYMHFSHVSLGSKPASDAYKRQVPNAKYQYVYDVDLDLTHDEKQPLEGILRGLYKEYRNTLKMSGNFIDGTLGHHSNSPDFNLSWLTQLMA